MEGLTDCFAAIEMDSSYLRAFQRRADIFLALGDFSSAAQDLKTIIARGGGRQLEARTLLMDVQLKANLGLAIDAYRWACHVSFTTCCHSFPNASTCLLRSSSRDVTPGLKWWPFFDHLLQCKAFCWLETNMCRCRAICCHHIAAYQRAQFQGCNARVEIGRRRDRLSRGSSVLGSCLSIFEF